jgi:hypothetical protein
MGMQIGKLMGASLVIGTTDLSGSADISIQIMDAALQDFEVLAVRAWHVQVGKLEQIPVDFTHSLHA